MIQRAILPLLAALAGAIMSLWLNAGSAEHVLSRDFINIWFDSDIGRVADNMTIRDEGHMATFKHPIFSITTYPLTSAARLLGLERETALAAVLALNAAVFMALFVTLLQRAGVRAQEQALGAVLCLGSGGVVFWFGVPETFPFGATSVLASILILDLARARLDTGPAWPRWAVATALSLSMTITNIVAAFGAAALMLLRSSDWMRSLRVILIGGTAGVIGLAVIAVVQDQLFGDAGLFFNPRALIGETQFFASQLDTLLLGRLQTLFVQTVAVGPPMLVEGAPGTAGQFRVDARWPESGLGWMATLDWMLLALVSLGLIAVHWRRMPPVVAICALYLLLNTIIHLIYGAAVFLYVAHFVGPLLIVILWGFAQKTEALNRAGSIALAVVAVMVMGSNIMTYRATMAAADAAYIAAAQEAAG
ncbi:hypothetical protein [Primorskyibacter sp. S187A]|uniref:hypothetical protein n=1 Tax=Primorskyibacter sp. S187A TaxID=3415130 RepID=UPI003C7E209E